MEDITSSIPLATWPVGSGPWWDENWLYWKELNISNAISDYQMSITVYKEDGHDDAVNSVIDCEGHCSDNFSDIRFIAGDGTTELAYWIEGTGTDGGDHYAVIWVNTSGDSNISMYYGNSGASTTSDGTNTFILFDDFSIDTDDEWYYYSPPANAEYLRPIGQTLTSARFRYKSKLNEIDSRNWAGDATQGLTDTNSSDPYASTNNYTHLESTYNTDMGASETSPTLAYRSRNGSGSDGTARTGGIITEGNTYIFEQRFHSTNAYVDIWDLSGTNYYSITLTVVPQEVKFQVLTLYGREEGGCNEGVVEWVSGSPSYLRQYARGSHYGCDSHVEYYIYWMFISKYTDTEPSWNGFSDENRFTPTVSNIVPSDGATQVSVPPISFDVTISDPNGDSMDIALRTNASGSWITFNSDTNKGNGTYVFTNTSWVDAYLTKYWWSVNVTDGNGWTNETYYFSTKALSTLINAISPYNQTSSPLAITATGDSGLDNVALWYRYSTDNLTWCNGWWDADWNYRKKLSVSNTSSGYQIKIIVGNISGGNVTCDGHAQKDFDDIRFISNITGTEIPYWRENYTDDTQATFWINNSYNDSVIKIYYGNDGASTTSNGNTTFIWFEGFYGDDYNSSRWEIYDEDGSTHATVADGIMNHISDSSTHSHFLFKSGYNVSCPGSKMLCTKVRSTYDTNPWATMPYISWYTENATDTDAVRILYRTEGGNRHNSMSNLGGSAFEGVADISSNIWTADTWFYFNFYVDPDDEYLKTQIENSDHTQFGNAPTRSQSYYGDFDEIQVDIYMRPYFSGRNNSIDYIYIREWDYSSAEPSWSDFGNEETNGWIIWNDASNPDTTSPWSWNFNFPDGIGYYEFYSIGKKSGSSDEIAPGGANAICHFVNPPAVISTTPADGSTGISISTNIVVNFNKPMNRTSVEDNFDASPSVGGNFSWNNDNKTLTLNPSSSLGYSKTYTITVDQNAADTWGNSMLADYAWIFITKVKPYEGPAPSYSSINGTEEEQNNTTDQIEDLCNITLNNTIYADDADGDGIVDTFVDPNDVLTSIHSADLNGSVLFLVSADDDDIPEFFWDTKENVITPITHTPEKVVDMKIDTKEEAIVVTITVEKANWIYIEAEDRYQNMHYVTVITSDGRIISSDMIWRENGKIYVLDDPDTEYHFVYSDVLGAGVGRLEPASEEFPLTLPTIIAMAIISIFFILATYKRRQHSNYMQHGDKKIEEVNRFLDELKNREN